MLITYRPGPHDRAQVKWKGFTFEANVPRECNDPEILKLAPGNPYFSVGDAPPAPNLNIWDRRKKPKNAEEYRRYAMTWLNDTNPNPTASDGDAEGRRTARAIVKRFDDEDELRDACGVGMDDKELLATIFDPKLATLDPTGSYRPKTVTMIDPGDRT